LARSPAPRPTPRISANDLALYMVSSETARMGIIRRAKHPPTAPIIRYRDVRPAICAYLADPTRRVNPLVAAEEMFVQRAADTAESTLRQDDARQSIEVLHSIQRMANQLAQYDFSIAPQDQAKPHLSGVEVSIRADLLVRGVSRGRTTHGAAVLRMTQDDADTETARAKRREMGIYVAVLVRTHVEQHLAHGGAVSNRLCMSIDVQHGEIFHAPDASTRRMNDLENACLFIAAMWPQL
jgi:hypothetical protein